MAAKKKYPEPCQREDRKIYYFNFLGKDGKRRRLASYRSSSRLSSRSWRNRSPESI